MVLANGSAVPDDTSDSSPIPAIILSFVLAIIFVIISLGIICRQSRFVVEVANNTVTLKPYRFFGLISLERDRKEFAQSELGLLVLDTQLRNSCWSWSNCLCCCCCGFNGIYVTKGLPRDCSSVEIAFEIPFYHLTQYSPLYHVCHVRTFETSFRSLAECLGFVTRGVVDAHSQVTTPGHTEVIRGGWAAHQMAMVKNMEAQMDAISDDAKANYRNFLAYNPRCDAFTERTKLGGRGIARNRAVYYFADGPEPPYQSAPMPAPPVFVPRTPAAVAPDYESVRARNKATLDQLLATWSANDYNKMIQLIPSLYRPDYTCSSTVNQQPTTYSKFSELPAGFNYIFNTLQGQYYNCEVLPDQDGDPCILRGRNKIRYPQSDWNCWFTIRFDERGMMAHGDYFAQKCE